MAEKFDTLKTNDDSTEEIDLCDPTAKLRLPPIEIGPNEHPLQFGYALWYTRNPIGKITDSGYAQNLRLVGRFATVEQFWSLYSHLLRPSELMSNSDFHLFKNGIKPMWEDVNNRLGGRFQLKLRKGLVDRCWENLLLALLGEQFMVGEEICGVVVSVKFGEDKLYVWNRKCEDIATRARIRDTLKRVLNIPADARMKYKTHNDALKYVAPKGQDE